ncbi:MAG: hypothetical protein SWH54_16420 [Thermodesulfobacteriota bacterium]|nr:hypothetical protein [Thermodesulfobacteriota bacterium]
MKRVCCKCGKYLGEKPGPKDAVTHGFCDPCLEIYRAEMMVALENIEKAGRKKDQASPSASGYASKLRPDKMPSQRRTCRG